MNIIVIYGSPHTSGTTSSLLGAFLSGLAGGETGTSITGDGAPPAGGGSAVYIETFNVYDMDIRPCSDCGACSALDCCRFGDLDGFDEALRRCSGLIIASPVYQLSFPAPLKALFDRTQRYYLARRLGRPVFPGATRPAAVLLAAGQKSETGKVIKEQLGRILPPLGARISEFVVAGGTDSPAADVSALPDAEAAGVRFRAILS